MSRLVSPKTLSKARRKLPQALSVRFLTFGVATPIRLRLDQPPDQRAIDTAGCTALRHPLVAAGQTLGGGDLQHPTVAHTEPLSQRPHRAFASRIGRQTPCAEDHRYTLAPSLQQ